MIVLHERSLTQVAGHQRQLIDRTVFGLEAWRNINLNGKNRAWDQLSGAMWNRVMGPVREQVKTTCMIITYID